MRIHVTDLDQLGWYHKLETMTADQLVARLMRTEPPNEKMFLGSTFHSLLESCPDKIDSVSENGYNFTITCDAEIKAPQIKEVRAHKEYDVDGRKVFLSGKCDGITGNKVIDHKLSFRPNPEYYFESYQWRAYLDIFSADIFQYILYSAKQKDNDIEIYDISVMDMYRYPGMKDDVITGIRNFLDFVDHNCPEYGR